METNKQPGKGTVIINAIYDNRNRYNEHEYYRDNLTYTIKNDSNTNYKKINYIDLKKPVAKLSCELVGYNDIRGHLWYKHLINKRKEIP